MPLIIDGHNLLWAIANTDEDFESISDVQLCRILSGFLGRTRTKGEVVFDGAGPPDKNAFNSVANIEIIFAGGGSDADSVIEDKIAASTAPRLLRVVSSDRRIRDAAKVRKAKVIKSEDFWVEVKRQLGRRAREAEPRAKRAGLSESETKQWLEFFGFEQ